MMFGEEGQHKFTKEEAMQIKRRMAETLEVWRSIGKLDYVLNEQGKVARLEDARDLAKTLANALMQVLSSPNVQMIMMMTGDPDEYQFLGQLGIIAHTLVCDDPECRINNPELGLDEGAA